MSGISCRAAGIASLVILTLIWGTTFPAIKTVVTGVGFAYYVSLRFGLATLLLTPIAVRKARELRQYLRPGAVLGLLYFGGITLQGLGMRAPVIGPQLVGGWGCRLGPPAVGASYNVDPGG
ncbi:MAG: hypothetical protein DRK00_10565 [Thermoprotei archaeon]|nr:MAG: hypothetical protein DRK00_10565 [Thermoprotei archaeon]